MYKFKHFLGYGLIIQEKELKNSPYRADFLEKKFQRQNQIIQLDLYCNSPQVFIGFLLDKDDDNFIFKMKEAEKNINQLYFDIFKIDIPLRKYKPKMYAKYGNVWEEEQ